VAREKQHNNLFFHGHKIPRKNNDYIKSITIKKRKFLSSSGMFYKPKLIPNGKKSTGKQTLI
jgi:hypothetical protein